MDYQFGQAFVNGDPYLSDVQVRSLYSTDMNIVETSSFVSYNNGGGVNTQYQPEPSGNGLDIMYWNGQDCVNWAQNVCTSHGIDPTCVNLTPFGSLTGDMLVNFNEYDFYRIDSNYGHTFFQELRRLMEQCGIAPNSPVPINVARATETEYQPPEDSNLMDISMEIPLNIENLDQYLNDDNQNMGLEHLDSFQHIGDIKCEYGDEEENLFQYESRLHEVPSSPVYDESSFDGASDNSPPCSPSPSSHSSGRDVLGKIKTTSRKRGKVRGPKNWEYLMRLLVDEAYNPSVIKWEDEDQWTFRIVKKEVVAHIWGQRSNKPNLTYDNFARGLRYHYTTGALKAVSERQLVYKCGTKAQKYLRQMQQSGR